MFYAQKVAFHSEKKGFLSGNSSDLVIEQDLMRLFKVSGGVTRGRGITDSTNYGMFY